jgi:hypothetical protein
LIENKANERFYFATAFAVLLSSCEVTETLHINADGSGTVEFDSHRNEACK